MRDLIRENLHQDLEFWVNKVKQSGKPLLPADVYTLSTHMMKHTWAVANVKLVLVYNNTWLHLDPANSNLTWVHALCPRMVLNHSAYNLDPCDSQLRHIVTQLHSATRGGRLSLPDSLFVLTVTDNVYRVGHVKNQLAAPVFSLQKFWGNHSDLRDTEIAVPMLKTWFSRQPAVPWDRKNDTAFWHGTDYCSPPDNRRNRAITVCSRYYLYCRSHQDMGHLLVMGTMHSRAAATIKMHSGYCRVNMTGGQEKSMMDHAQHKFLLHIEGLSASYRLGQLLGLDSLVLWAQETWHVEFFYRSLRPWQHFVPFWQTSPDDLFPLLEQLKRIDQQQPELLQAIVQKAQQFAYSYLSLDAKLLYWKRALRGYNRLFDRGEMRRHIRHELVPRLIAAGFNMQPCCVDV